MSFDQIVFLQLIAVVLIVAFGVIAILRHFEAQELARTESGDEKGEAE
ncbi:hypothetical protein [Erythrobacter sp. EC-HK427]|nr:hypothetical protein [Erythrobacter sp. EC-HK427]VVT16399.1 hypothetical protein ERY430_70358 [Erythrobacter sp. EC-HK427]